MRWAGWVPSMFRPWRRRRRECTREAGERERACVHRAWIDGREGWGGGGLSCGMFALYECYRRCDYEKDCGDESEERY